MVKVSIQSDAVVFEVQGLHKLWAFKSRLEVPRVHIKNVRADPDAARGFWKGFRMPGTHLPGILVAGTFFKGGKRFFWDVRNKQNTIVVELEGDPYDQLIIEVEDPAGEITRLRAAVAASPLT
jgi:hypothetical protein